MLLERIANPFAKDGLLLNARIHNAQVVSLLCENRFILEQVREPR